MNNIVSITDGRAVTTSLAVADGVGNPHSTVIRLIRDNIDDLREFGPLGFEIHVVNRPQGGGAPTEYAILNEPYQRVVDQGLLDVKVRTFEHPTNGTTTRATARITGKGLARLQQVAAA